MESLNQAWLQGNLLGGQQQRLRCWEWQARPEDMLEPAETPEEATRRMLDAKKLSSKINYNVLANLFSDTRPEQ